MVGRPAAAGGGGGGELILGDRQAQGHAGILNYFLLHLFSSKQKRYQYVVTFLGRRFYG
jgi:hypothetical protein